MESNIPLVSVIVPNYNHEQFIKQRLESILSQNYANFEIIILDDCSTDNSREILLEYANNPHVSYCVFNEVNSGSPFKQWEKGINLAKGEYIWVAESDDLCKSNFIESLIKMFRANVAMVFCASINIDENGLFTGSNRWANSLNSNKWKSNYCNDGESEIKDYLKFRNFIPNASSVIFKKNVVNDNFFANDFFYCGDWFFWLKILQNGRISYLSDELNFFRKHAATTRVVKNFLEEKKRFKEYTFITKKYTSRREFWTNYRKYIWIVNECITKSSQFNFIQLIQLKMPYNLKIIFWLKYFRLKFKE